MFKARNTLRIVLTGGGTGGHFYPVIAVAQALQRSAERENLVGLEYYYVSDTPYDQELLNRHRLKYVEVRTGKIRTYASAKNISDKFLTFFAVLKALWKLFILYPDVVFGKGGYASFPAVAAARILRIPVVVHDSDSIPGRVNRWAAPYAEAVGVAFPEAAKYFPKADRVALIGNPIREEVMNIVTEAPEGFFEFDPAIPTILVMGGSQGSEKINEILVDILPRLLDKYQVIHQCGKNNLVWMKARVEGVLKGHPYQRRYRLYPFLDTETLRYAAGAAKLILSRAGSGLFEFALWGIPSILIPLPIAREDHQRENAYSYARTGACSVIEETNLRPELLFSSIERTLDNPEVLAQMKAGTAAFAKRDAADKIAQMLLSISLSHV